MILKDFKPNMPNLSLLNHIVQQTDPVKVNGRVTDVVGLVIEATGPVSKLGDYCEVRFSATQPPLKAEVVGFRDGKVLLMPIGEMEGVGPGNEVVTAGKSPTIAVGNNLLGRVINALGEPMDGLGPIDADIQWPINNCPPNAMERKLIDKPLPLGVRSIDGFLTVGSGQRMGIFAGSGVGKSTLLGMIARYAAADVNVIGLIGERGREVREFIENDLGEEGLKRSVVVIATSDQPALVRIKAAFMATAISEYFREQGLEVMLMMDSLTRLAMAQREVGLAIGEPPTTKGYTPSVFSMLPRLLERSGQSAKGSITAIYTVLVEGDDTNEPVADTVRSILDGHIVLTRQLAHKGHYPPIDILQSISRVMPMITSSEHYTTSLSLRDVLATYKEAEDLIAIGAYQMGTNPKIDQAIRLMPLLENFLKQNKSDHTSYDDAFLSLMGVMNG